MFTAGILLVKPGTPELHDSATWKTEAQDIAKNYQVVYRRVELSLEFITILRKTWLHSELQIRIIRTISYPRNCVQGNRTYCSFYKEKVKYIQFSKYMHGWTCA